MSAIFNSKSISENKNEITSIGLDQSDFISLRKGNFLLRGSLFIYSGKTETSTKLNDIR